MDKYIVTVDTNFGREVICTLQDIEDGGKHYRRTEIASYQEVCDWVQKSQVAFPHATYRIYKLERKEWVL